MYLQFFGLNGSPFPAVPMSGHYFGYAASHLALDAIESALTRQAGPCLIIGPAGTGKSMLLAVLAERRARSRHVIALGDARLPTRRSLLQTLACELGLEYEKRDEGELRLDLTRCLRTDPAVAQGILLLVDEAHTLSQQLLDELRMLSNVIRDQQSQVQLVLAGTSHLEENLADPAMESLNQRVACRVYLSGMGLEELPHYLGFQWRRAGGDCHPFAASAIEAIQIAAHGNPRLINQLCDLVLLTASQRQVAQIDEDLVQAAWSELHQIPLPKSISPANSSESGLPSPASIVEFGSLDLDEDAPVPPQGTTAGYSTPAPLACDSTQMSPDSSSRLESVQPSRQDMEVGKFEPKVGRGQGERDRDRQQNEVPSSAPHPPVQPSITAGQVAPAETLITFAFQADIQPPNHRPIGADVEPSQPDRPSADPIQLERKFETVQYALESIDQDWNSVDQMLAEADMQAVTRPLDVWPQAAANQGQVDDTPPSATDPALVFDDHLYLESLWLDDTVWAQQVQLPEPNAGPATASPSQPNHPSAVPVANPSLGTAASVKKQAAEREIRIDHDSAETFNHSMQIDRWAKVKPIDSAEAARFFLGDSRVGQKPIVCFPNSKWSTTDPPLVNRQQEVPMPHDDACVIQQQRENPGEDASPQGAPATSWKDDDRTLIPHEGQNVEPPVLAKRKDLRALLHALRGY